MVQHCELSTLLLRVAVYLVDQLTEKSKKSFTGMGAYGSVLVRSH